MASNSSKFSLPFQSFPYYTFLMKPIQSIRQIFTHQSFVCPPFIQLLPRQIFALYGNVIMMIINSGPCGELYSIKVNLFNHDITV